MAEEHLRIETGAAEVIKSLMDAQGVSQVELARRVGTSRAYVAQVLSPGLYNDHAHSVNTYQRFAGALGASLDATWAASPSPQARPPSGRLKVSKRSKKGAKK